MFVQVETDCVFQINKNTGEHTIHGELKPPEPVYKKSEETEEEKTERKRRQEEKDKFKKLGRNDLCACGSGKKFKNCCIDKHF